jgi:hypothetical protein
MCNKEKVTARNNPYIIRANQKEIIQKQGTKLFWDINFGNYNIYSTFWLMTYNLLNDCADTCVIWSRKKWDDSI